MIGILSNNRIGQACAVVALTGLGAAAAVLSAPAYAQRATCITDAELETAVADQLRSGAFAINTSKLKEAPMCSGLTVARAIQELGERVRGETPGTASGGYAPPSPAPATAKPLESARIASGGGTGRITGEFDFPSDYVPDDITACAEPVGGGRQICSGKATRTGGDVNYSIVVPAGRYRVSARTADLPGRRAYYSRYVTCPMRNDSYAHCKDHTPIIIEVKAGGVHPNVDPNDWYDD